MPSATDSPQPMLNLKRLQLRRRNRQTAILPLLLLPLRREALAVPVPPTLAWKPLRPFPMKAIRADTSVAPELNSGLSLSLQEPVSTPFALQVIWIPLVLFTIVAAIRLPELTIMLLAERSISVLSAISPKERPTISRLVLAKGM